MHPKDIERNRRDMNSQPTAHDHIHFDDCTKIPTKWREMLGCRKCKRELVVYLGDCFLRIAPRFLHGSQKLVIGGGCNDPEQDQCLSITENTVEHIEPQYKSTAEEADTRVWLHAKHSAGERKLIFSPDTDVYHIGLECANLTSTEVIIQLSSISRGKPVYMQNFRFIGAMVSEFRFFKKKKMKNMDNLIKLCLPVFRTSD